MGFLKSPGTLFLGLTLVLYVVSTASGQGYYGIRIGPLSQLHHAVSGEVFAVDARTIFIKNFNYDGEGPAAYFYVGTSRRPSNNGAIRLRDERGSAGVLRRYRNKDITLSLPEGKTLRDINWFSVWCDDFAVNFGDVSIPKNLDYPRPHKIGALAGVHEVSSENIVIVDAQTLLIPNFSYDGEAPDAKFWVGRGPKPTSQGIRIPDENGKEDPLRRYDKKTIVLTLPGDLTVFDIGHFGVWCEAFTVDFGHVRIPEGIVVPPSLKMLGVSPQSKLNCEVLYDDLAFEVRWAIAGESIVVQLVAKLDGNEYMSFGVSSNSKRSEMVGGDVAVVWVDKNTGKGYAQDYYLEDKSQCSGTRGSCPDTRINDNTNSIRLLNAAMVNGYSIVTYQRPLKAADSLDVAISTNESQAVIWALGPLNQRYEVSFHSQFTKGDRFIDFGRQPVWNCPMPETDGKNPGEEDYEEEFYEKRPEANPSKGPLAQRQPESRPAVAKPPPPPRPPATPKPTKREGAWDIPPILCNEPDDGVFYAQMGPTGGKHGYPAITGHVGWGISWYINGLLIPEINVVRGRTYTFVTEGGFNPDIPAKYHPFYITDDPVGGYEHKTEEEKANVKIFAGVHQGRNGDLIPTGIGRLCNWTPDQDGPPADDYSSFGAYQRTLTLKCDRGEPGIINWVPDHNTPDTVYYQCFTHRYLGWKINVVDECDEAQASEIDEVYADPENEEGIEAEPSIRHETKVRVNENYLQSDRDTFKNHNMNGSPPKLHIQVPGGGSSEMNKLISTGIRAAEALEQQVRTSGNVTIPLEEINLGEEFPGLESTSAVDIKIPNAHQVQSNPDSGFPLYLKPPQNGQFLRPAKVPLRRFPPQMVERRPMNNNNRPPRPFILPQPSMLVNHYKPLSGPPPPMQSRPYMKMKHNKPILILGESTEIKSHPIRQQIPEFMNKFPRERPAPFPDHVPQGYMKKPDKPVTYPQHQKSPPQKVIPINKEQEIPVPNIQYTIPQEVPRPTFRPAENTGFEPHSVIVESGFRPIVNRKNADIENKSERKRDEQRRRSDIDIISEIDEAIESDALLINSNNGEPNKSFEPMFIPSPRDDVNGMRKNKTKEESKEPKDLPKKHHRNGIKKRKPVDLGEMDFEDGEDKMAVAAERLDTYYLPPDNRKVANDKFPEGAVVTYDGKAVLDTSLINSAPMNDLNVIYSHGMTKTEQLVRNTPQFGPFKGEMPPPIGDFVSPDSLPQLKSYQRQTPVTEYSNPLENIPVKKPASAPISTKLTLLKSANLSRKKRHDIKVELNLPTASGAHRSKFTLMGIMVLLISISLW